ncbi:CpaF family protein [Candidatus Micrarchaeota archaeon]|nr:CpaF family protein [Candidatus Micrarchaeota archaeon]
MDLDEALRSAKAERKPSRKKSDAVPADVSHDSKTLPVSSPFPVPSETGEKVLVESYGDVHIYKEEGEPLYWYEIPAPHLRGEEKALISTLLEIASGVIGEAEGLTESQKRTKYLEKILQIIEATPELKVPIHAKQFYAEAVVKEMVGYGLIDPLLQDESLEEIMIIGPKRPVFVFHRKYEMMKSNIIFYEDRDIRNLIDKMARSIGRRIDIQAPLLDARLPDGSRVNATIAPASIDGSTLTLRKFRKDPLTVIDLMNSGTVSLELAGFLWLISDGLGAKPANILVAGGTACGKTTTLNVLASFVPLDERIISIEDTAELNLPLEHWIRFEVRPSSAEGTGEINMDTLVKNSLRMRPDRVIVGEIRGAEGFTMFTAMNTGHHGCMGTVHSNSADETIVRLGAPPISVSPVMLNALNFVVMQHRIHDRRKGVIRRMTEVAEVIPGGKSGPTVQDIFRWDPAKDEILPTGSTSHFLQEIASFSGLTLKDIEEDIEERKRILAELQQKGFRSHREVCDVTQSYILKKRGRI